MPITSSTPTYCRCSSEKVSDSLFTNIGYHLTDIFIGAIIPQVQVRQWVGDVRSGPNHIKFNIYPGKNNVSTLTLLLPRVSGR